MEEITLECGCTVMSHIIDPDGTKRPYCAIHDCSKIADKKPDLTGRIARCFQCGNERPSSFNIAFFSYNENSKYDSYYCGCRGWN